MFNLFAIICLLNDDDDDAIRFLDYGSMDIKLVNFSWQVDYSGFMTINPQRFGQKYVGKVPLCNYGS